MFFIVNLGNLFLHMDNFDHQKLSVLARTKSKIRDISKNACKFRAIVIVTDRRFQRENSVFSAFLRELQVKVDFGCPKSTFVYRTRRKPSKTRVFHYKRRAVTITIAWIFKHLSLVPSGFDCFAKGRFRGFERKTSIFIEFS